jgi:hypothetical protein
MGSLVHTGLGSFSLVANVLPFPPPPHVNSFVLGPAVIINTHTRPGPSLFVALIVKNSSTKTKNSEVLHHDPDDSS